MADQDSQADPQNPCGQHNIFLTHSGETSREVALALDDWLRLVIHSARPWISTSIPKGEFWSQDLINHLKECKIGIICLTPANLTEPWVLFEAGALALRFSRTKACPYLLNLKPADVGSPLSLLQLTVADREDTERLVLDINQSLGTPTPDEVVKRSFDKFWPELESKLTAIGKKTGTPRKRGSDELLSEILQTVRGIDKAISSPPVPYISGVSVPSLSLQGLGSTGNTIFDPTGFSTNYVHVTSPTRRILATTPPIGVVFSSSESGQTSEPTSEKPKKDDPPRKG